MAFLVRVPLKTFYAGILFQRIPYQSLSSMGCMVKSLN